MSTPSIQTLITQAQQVLNLKSSNEIRATLAAILANANVGTPLNPNLTTQQLWDEFYEIVRQPSDDIMSIITDQMMRMVFSPPAPGGAGADKQVIFNDGGVLAGDAGLTYNKATDALTISGDLTVDTSTLKVDSTLNKVGIGVATLTGLSTLNVAGDVAITSDLVLKNGSGTAQGYIFGSSGINYRVIASNPHVWQEGGTDLMRLNSTGLGIGASPSRKLSVSGAAAGLDVTDTTQSTRLRIRSSSASNFFIEALNSAESAYVTLRLNDTTQIDSSGNVGIGITPSAWATATTIWRALDLQYSCGIASSGAGSGEIDFLWNAYYDQTDQRWEFKYTGDRASRYAIGGAGVHTWYNTASTGTANLPITWVPAMTLDASGNLLVGSATNTNSSRVFIRNGSAASPSLALQGITGDTNQAGLLVGKFDNDSTSAQILVRFTINNNSGGSGQINANGASQAAFGSYSDSRLKENIVSLPSQLANILSLRPVEFDYKDGSGHQIGFVAQEIQKVYSDTVGEQDGFLTVTGWSKTEARLVSAIKELAAKVQALEAKVA